MDEPKQTVFDKPDLHGRGSGPLETVVIETPEGPVTINKSDFDKKIHKLADVTEKTSTPAGGVDATVFDSMTKDDLILYLNGLPDERKVEFDPKALKADLLALAKSTLS